MRTLDLNEAVEAALDGRSNVVLCPAHDDSSPSLSISPGKTQPVLFKCHAGCEPDAIIEAGGLDWSKVCKPLDLPDLGGGSSRFWTPRGQASHIYPYYDESGTLLYEVLRVPLDGGKKSFMQRRPDSTAPHGHRWNLDGTRRVLYRLPQVVEAVKAGQVVHFAEGEKCADALQAAIPDGEVATTSPQGAGKWAEEFGEVLAGATVVIYSDTDEKGQAHARQVRESLIARGCTVSIKEPAPGVLPSGKHVNDVADHLELGLGLDTLLETTPEQIAERARTGIDILDVIIRPRGRVEFAIDDTLAKGERCVLIGFEGHGKSTLCRQIAVMVSAGLHPFTGMPLKEPRKVMYIDAENHPDQTLESWGHLVGLAARHGYEVERGMLTLLEEHDTQPDLTSADGAAWLMERVHAYQPDLVVMGPLTNLASSDLREDMPVRRLLLAVDRARSACNSAFWMEHHAPHKGPGDKVRIPRPYGSSMFLKRPDYGFGMRPTDDPKVYEWMKNRGPRVRTRRWPEALREGVPNSLEWPWMETVLPEDQRVG